ncbi:hypothetical protein HNQ88_001278 [Aureibacter tunicatorum]|uniref:Uncharacterized protein n=1 Tax=Aureibacter tunicatorum TaxID=866807 RepID=A0AAE4BSE4_9BACT|nr:hypothetical protein [Aureibacter tunicatorum]BDD03334.1 hypothetical protein AUTU_08170 [Aureibacter tunicatorum]
MNYASCFLDEYLAFLFEQMTKVIAKRDFMGEQ